jgi:ribosomal-protein-alanine N-acetyltransferase
MTEAYDIRQFNTDDIRDVVQINKECLPENYPDQFFLGLHYHAPKAFLIAKVNAKTVGYIMCRIERGISSFGRLPTKKGHIVSVAVLQEERHKGIGTAIIKAGMKAMEDYGAEEFFLEVRKSNEAAVSVYESLGYEARRVLRGYYRDGEDAYLMVAKAQSAAKDVNDNE